MHISFNNKLLMKQIILQYTSLQNLFSLLSLLLLFGKKSILMVKL